MEIKDMKLEDVEARMSELDSLVETSENTEEIAKATEERALLNERKAELVALETRKAQAKEIDNGATVQVVELRKEERKTMDIKELRNSDNYINAFAEMIKTGDETEVRSLLTTNGVADGQIAVPDFVSDTIKTDWLESGILNKVKKVSFPGNFKQQFELTSTDATIHTEGSGAVSEEELTLGTIEMIPKSIKKWISISDEALDLKGRAFLDYIVKELSYKITVKAEGELIGKIKNLSTSASASAVNAKKVKAGAAVTTIAAALGELNAEAKNPVVVMHPSTKAAYIAAARTANFALDPFEGLEVYTTNDLPAISSASENDVYAIVGDFGFGALANFPKGEGIEIKIDDKSKMEYDLVRILGREFIAVEPVACRAFVNITKPAAV